MSYSSEQDPLLPKGPGAPEIQGSRPQSVKDAYAPAPATEVDETSSNNIQNRPNNIWPQLFGICVFAAVFFMLTPPSLYDDIAKHLRPRPNTVEERVSRILEETPLIDGHNDLAIMIRYLFKNRIYGEDFTKPFEQGGMPYHVDLPRLKKGKNGGAFWSAYVGCPEDGTDFSDENYAIPIASTLSQIDLLTRLQHAYPTHFSPPPNSTTALSFFQNNQLISPLAIEGLHQIGNSISNLRHYYDLGVRYATLTHNCHNPYADAALIEISGHTTLAPPKWGGVSPRGRELIHEMNRIGMIVDLAHVSQNTMRDVLGGSPDWEAVSRPLSSAILPHIPSVPIHATPDFVSCTANSSNPYGIPDFYPKNSTLEHVVTHIIHIGNLIGYDHVGLGSDYDGIGSTPKGLEDVSKFPDLVAEMLRRGISDEDAAKVVGGNVLRVWADVDAVATKLQAKGVRPLEDELPNLWGEQEFDSML